MNPPKTDHDMIQELWQAVCGFDGQPGLLKDYAEHKSDYLRFKTRVLIVFFFLLGTGALGIGITELIKHI